MARLDLNSFAGLVLAIGAIIAGQLLEGGHFGSLVQLTAFVIVVGGTLGAVLVQSPVKAFASGMKMGLWVFVPPLLLSQPLVRQIVEWSHISRR